MRCCCFACCQSKSCLPCWHGSVSAHKEAQVKFNRNASEVIDQVVAILNLNCLATPVSWCFQFSEVPNVNRCGKKHWCYGDAIPILGRYVSKICRYIGGLRRQAQYAKSAPKSTTGARIAWPLPGAIHGENI